MKWIKRLMLLLVPVTFFVGCSGVSTNVTTSKQNLNKVASYKGPKARIAVASFKCKAAKCNGQIGSGIADMLTTALFRSGKFIVVERSNEGLSAIQKEYGLNTNMNRPVKNLEGADILVVGAITAFEPKAGGITAGGIVVPKGVPFIGGMKFGKNEAYIAADIRLIDVRTGRVINATTVEGRASKWNIGGLGGGLTSSLALGGGLGVYKNTPMEKAVRVMINNAVKEISKLVPKNYYRYNAQGQPVANTQAQPVANIQTNTSSANSVTYTQNTQKENLKLVFGDDFESYDIGRSLPVGNWEGKGSIDMAVGANMQSSKVLKLKDKDRACIKNFKIKNFVLTFDYSTHPWTENYVLFRFNKKANFGYEIDLRRGNYILYKVTPSNRIIFAKRRINFIKKDWHKAKIIANNSLIELYIDGNLAISVHDNDNVFQQPGSICFGTTYYRWFVDNVKVYKEGKK